MRACIHTRRTENICRMFRGVRSIDVNDVECMKDWTFLQAPSTSDQPLDTNDDDGLIDLGEQDDMFDPLVRSSSNASRSGSLLRSSGSASSQSAFAFLRQSKGEELTSSGDLFGTPPTTNVQQQPQQLGMAGQTMQPPMMGMNIMSPYVRAVTHNRKVLIAHYNYRICYPLSVAPHISNNNNNN